MVSKTHYASINTSEATILPTSKKRGRPESLPPKRHREIIINLRDSLRPKMNVTKV